MIWLCVNQLGNKIGIRMSGKNVAVVINKSAMTGPYSTSHCEVVVLKYIFLLSGKGVLTWGMSP